jgi:hypothetical protein
MNEWDYLPAILGSVLFICTSGVILLRPISKQLANLIAEMVAERQNRLHGEGRHVRDLIEGVDRRLDLIEERMEFTEKLLSSGDRSTEEGSGFHHCHPPGHLPAGEKGGGNGSHDGLENGIGIET